MDAFKRSVYTADTALKAFIFQFNCNPQGVLLKVVQSQSNHRLCEKLFVLGAKRKTKK